MNLRLNVNRLGAATVVSVDGEVDLNNSGDVLKGLRACIIEKRDVIVDLSGVGFMDSSGVASLIEAFQLAKQSNLRFSLVSVSAAVLRVLRLARLDEVFVIHPDAETAMAG